MVTWHDLERGEEGMARNFVATNLPRMPGLSWSVNSSAYSRTTERAEDASRHRGGGGVNFTLCHVGRELEIYLEVCAPVPSLD